MILFLLYLFGALCWISWAFGFMTYEPWVVTFAFVLLAINMVLAAMKSLVE